MPNCEHCTDEQHSPEGCANRTVPMIHRTCTCPCGRTGIDPAPYWTTRGEHQ